MKRIAIILASLVAVSAAQANVMLDDFTSGNSFVFTIPSAYTVTSVPSGSVAGVRYLSGLATTRPVNVEVANGSLFIEGGSGSDGTVLSVGLRANVGLVERAWRLDHDFVRSVFSGGEFEHADSFLAERDRE